MSRTQCLVITFVVAVRFWSRGLECHVVRVSPLEPGFQAHEVQLLAAHVPAQMRRLNIDYSGPPVRVEWTVERWENSDWMDEGFWGDGPVSELHTE